MPNQKNKNILKAPSVDMPFECQDVPESGVGAPGLGFRSIRREMTRRGMNENYAEQP